MSGHCKHAVLHHTYVNITNHDADINLGLFARLTPSQKRFWFHRGQRVYLWPLYGLWAIKWHLLSDFRNVIIGRIGGRRFSRPTGWNLAFPGLISRFRTSRGGGLLRLAAPAGR
jgi:linoleoyl-CoA desaturase